MSETAALQLRRLLAVIPRLADGGDHSLGAVAAAAGASRDVLVKDLESLSVRFDEPGGFVEGVQIYLESDRVSLVTNHFLRPMRLSVSELCALELGLAMLRGERAPHEHRAIDGARARLREVIALLPSQGVPGGDRHAWAGAAGDPAQIDMLRRALRSRRAVRIAYRKAAAPDAEHRDVRPYALVAVRGAWYLVAHCERSADVRLFRLDRVDSAEQTGATYAIPADFALDEWVRGGVAFRAAAPDVLRVRYSPRIARWIAEREQVAPDADGSVVVEHPMADVDWAVRHVLQYGADAEVLSPAHVRAEIVRRLRAVLGSSGSAKESVS